MGTDKGGMNDPMTSVFAEFCERFACWESAVAKLGPLSPAQMRTVGVIGRNKNLRMKDIAEKMELTTGTVTVMVDRLQDMGFVERCRNESDRRSYKIVLSPKGERYFQEHVRRQESLVTKLTLGLKDDERRLLLNSLRRCIASF
ncbi:MAG: MarR family transcriptional regulator [Dethiosulfovibrio peptidovorans]|nr:MAG: MarR family transcriptional regulator [Dethiosulfovibrio peptidovorans]